MHSARLRELAHAKGPFASVYFDDSHNTPGAAHEIDLRWRALREELAAAGADDKVLNPIADALTNAAPSVGRSGRAVIANADGVLIDEHLIRPPVAPTARFSQLPYLIPLIEHGSQTPTHLVAVVDHAGADINVADDRGVVTHSETVEGSGYPVHHAADAESSGYGDPQQRSDEQRRVNIREVAQRITEIVDRDDTDTVFLVGETSSVSDLTAELPQRISERIVVLDLGARHSGIRREDLHEAIAAEFERRRNVTLSDAAQRFEAESGRDSGLSAEGLTSVCGALRDGNVETLVVGEIGGATVVDGGDLTSLAPTPEILSELGFGPARTLPADEALPMAAIAVAADVVRIDERIAPKDGVAALLRYPPRTRA